MNLGEIFSIVRLFRETAMAVSVPAEIDPPMVPSEMLIMNCLFSHAEGQRIGLIARETRLAQSRVSTVVGQLKERGWIETRVPPEDTRSTVVVLKPEIRAGMRKVLASDSSAFLNRLMEGASARERADVERALEILARRVRTEPAPR